MNILITPDDIIKRCLWHNYVKFVLKTKEQNKISDIVTKNEIISISEDDAYVIGLLKYIKTPNLIHRFNIEINEYITIKSTVINKNVLINKSILLKEILSFKNRFPTSYNPNDEYAESIKKLNIYLKDIYDKIKKLDDIKIINNKDNKTYTYVMSNKSLKIINIDKNFRMHDKL